MLPYGLDLKCTRQLCSRLVNELRACLMWPTAAEQKDARSPSTGSILTNYNLLQGDDDGDGGSIGVKIQESVLKATAVRRSGSVLKKLKCYWVSAASG